MAETSKYKDAKHKDAKQKGVYYNMNPLRLLLFGFPMETDHDEAEARLPKILALPIMSSDAISSVAYATQQVLLAFGAVGLWTAANQGTYNSLTLGITAVIVLLLVVVASSYWQTIHGYPSGGGSYVVSRTNVGAVAGLIAGGALLIDYILTVAVSIASGMQNLLSTPLMQGFCDPLTHSPKTEYLVGFSIVFIMLLTLANLRGLKESGSIFAMPTYFFIGMAALMILLGTCGPLLGWRLYPELVNQTVPPEAFRPVVSSFTQLMMAMLVLKAFANGCSAMTGVEAISNSVPAFRKPEAQNASMTLAIMACILAFLFAGISWLSTSLHVVYWEHGELTASPVIEQLSSAVFGKPSDASDLSWFRQTLYYCMQFSTTAILLLAANTSYTGFPRLASIMAEDRYLPRPLSNLGDKLVFSNGIILLGVFSALLIYIFNGKVDDLIPLYSVGVFTAFTLSQWGMVKHWQREKGPRWHMRAIINGIGAVLTFVVLADILVEKGPDPMWPPSLQYFRSAWVVVLLIFLLFLMFRKIARHYETLGKQLNMEGVTARLPQLTNTVLVLIPSLHRGIMGALAYARSISKDCRAIHINVEPNKNDNLKKGWEKYVGDDIPLVVLESPYRSLTGPLMAYLNEVVNERNHIVTVIFPEFVSNKWWHSLLHNNSALLLKIALLNRPGVIVSNARYFLEDARTRDMYNISESADEPSNGATSESSSSNASNTSETVRR